MNQTTAFIRSPPCLFTSMLAAVLLAGCASADKKCCAQKPAEVATANSVIRIHAGARASFTDSSGNVWLPDRGFVGGDVVVRASDMQIAKTKDAGLYRTEHWGMDSFSQRLPNGKYVVKLHFAETSPTIKGPGERLFSFNIQGHEFRDFDVWVKAGGPRRAYIETVNVNVADGKLDITFEAGVDSPEINGIEISAAP
jgi:malectin (di-glucose binding ER protein)